MLFADFGLAEPIQRAVAQTGYVTPTPIQAAAIPVVMQGLDVMGAAQTGTGKTAGFALPILHRLMRHANMSASPARHPVRALILAPTRELADQIYENVHVYAKFSGLRSTAVFGGVDIKPQIKALRSGAEVLIATPGRLLDHVEQKTVNLSQTEVLVLDEADRMLDMGFLPDIQRIIQLLPKTRQNLMFSATFSKDIRKLAEAFLNNPQLIEVARRNASAENVEQTIYRVRDAGSKRAAVAQIIRDKALSQVIVFTNTKIGASRLARELERDGLVASAIHGDKSQHERLATLEAFKQGEVKVLVATDVAARGLDIAELPAVINYDLPFSPEDYVHRIGRTGRAGASGLAISLMLNDDERLRADISKLIKHDLKPVDLMVTGASPAARSDRPERGERNERTERADRGARSTRRSPSTRSSSDNNAGNARSVPGYSSDPFFFKPYEEKARSEAEVEAAAASTDEKSIAALSTKRRTAGRSGQLPALLGGLKKATS
ncbi:MAG: DEAD/DEAH box helicase [Burkholderiaceae bacterium]